MYLVITRASINDELHKPCEEAIPGEYICKFGLKSRLCWKIDLTTVADLTRFTDTYGRVIFQVHPNTEDEYLLTINDVYPEV